MAKRDRVLPARKPRDRSRDDESLLIRSAETLGRTIGSLQRQLDGVTRRLSETADVVDDLPDLPLVGGADFARRGTRKKKKKKKSTKTTGTAPRKRAARQSASPARKSSKSRRRAATKKTAKKR